MEENNKYEWTSSTAAMLSALRIMNGIILSLQNCELSARNEAIRVHKRLSTNDLTIEELTDYLHQASVDLNINMNKR